MYKTNEIYYKSKLSLITIKSNATFVKKIKLQLGYKKINKKECWRDVRFNSSP